MQTIFSVCFCEIFFLSVFKLSGSVFISPDCHFRKKSVQLASSREAKILEKMRKDSSVS